MNQFMDLIIPNPVGLSATLGLWTLYGFKMTYSTTLYSIQLGGLRKIESTDWCKRTPTSIHPDPW